MRTLTIGEVAQRTGLATSTLRYYDRVGLVPADIHDRGPRRYDPSVLHRLALIQQCQTAGFSLEEIQTLLDQKDGWQALARAKQAELDRRIADLQAARQTIDAALACACDDVEACAQDSASDTPAAAAAPAAE